jgi:ribosome-associated heat shock protein Hsp15
MYKTRSLATDAVDGGHVEVNGKSAKPSTAVHVGDRVTVRIDQYTRVLEVVEVIDKRVGAPVAVHCYIDHSPPRPAKELIAPIFERDRGTGRPTKRDRRTLDKFRQ